MDLFAKRPTLHSRSKTIPTLPQEERAPGGRSTDQKGQKKLRSSPSAGVAKPVMFHAVAPISPRLIEECRMLSGLTPWSLLFDLLVGSGRSRYFASLRNAPPYLSEGVWGFSGENHIEVLFQEFE